MPWLIAGLCAAVLVYWGPKSFELPRQSWLKSRWLMAVTAVYTLILTLSYGLNVIDPIHLPWLLSLTMLALVDIKDKAVRVVDLGICSAFSLPLIHWGTVVPTVLLTLLVVMVLVALKYGLRQWYGQDAFGGADIWLIALILLALGGAPALVAIYVAIILSGLTGVVLMVTKAYTRRSYLPFIPFLALGVVVAIGFSDPLIALYLRFVTGA